MRSRNGWLRFEAIEVAAFDFGQGFRQREAGFGGEIRDEFADDHQGFRALGGFVSEAADDIGELRMHGDAEVGRQRPGRGGPDDHGRALPA